jgi:hypothetical protein
MISISRELRILSMVGIASRIPPQPREAMTEQASPESIFERALQCTKAGERTICLEGACGENDAVFNPGRS